MFKMFKKLILSSYYKYKLVIDVYEHIRNFSQEPYET
jgi:hypothetical protein